MPRLGQHPGKTYVGAPCQQCGSTEHYASTNRCAPCTRAYVRAYAKKTGRGKRRNLPPDQLERARAYDRRRWAAMTKEEQVRKNRATGARHHYGLTLEEYDGLIAQGCAICGRHEPELPTQSGKRLGIDHDHTNGKVRAALCGDCNRGLGCFVDSPQRLRDAARYLERHALAEVA